MLLSNNVSSPHPYFLAAAIAHQRLPVFPAPRAAAIYYYSTILLPLQIGKAGKSSEKPQKGRAILVYLCSFQADKPFYYNTRDGFSCGPQPIGRQKNCVIYPNKYILPG